MKLGFLTAALPGMSLEEVATWAAESGFGMLEIACWPKGKAERRYGGVTPHRHRRAGHSGRERSPLVAERDMDSTSRRWPTTPTTSILIPNTGLRLRRI